MRGGDSLSGSRVFLIVSMVWLPVSIFAHGYLSSLWHVADPVADHLQQGGRFSWASLRSAFQKVSITSQREISFQILPHASTWFSYLPA